ncbi:MAG: hypothetical protein WCK60_03655, partial [Candidatus Nomurabacteria bacterium]
PIDKDIMFYILTQNWKNFIIKKPAERLGCGQVLFFWRLRWSSVVAEFNSRGLRVVMCCSLAPLVLALDLHPNHQILSPKAERLCPAVLGQIRQNPGCGHRLNDWLHTYST